MTTQFRIALTALALILAPLASSAHHRDGHSGGGGSASSHDSRGKGHADTGTDADGTEDASTGGHPCANGLAAREVACVPPGQAAKGVTTEQWIGAATSTFEAGQDLTEDESFGLVANADRLGLPALPEGQAYAVAGDALIIVDVTETTAEDGTVTTTYAYNSTVRRAAFPGRSNG